MALRVHFPDGSYRSIAIHDDMTARAVVENVFAKINQTGDTADYGLFEITANSYTLVSDTQKPSEIRRAWGDSPPDINRFMFRPKQVQAPEPREGYLTKQGHFIKNWKRRWYRMVDGMMLYFRNHKDKTPQGCVSLNGATVREAPARINKPFCFQVVTEDGGVHIAYAGSEEEQVMWMEAIQEWVEYLHILRSKRHAQRSGQRGRRNSEEYLAAIEAGVSYTPASTSSTATPGGSSSAAAAGGGGASSASTAVANSPSPTDASPMAAEAGAADNDMPHLQLTDADVADGLNETFTSKMTISDFELLKVLGKGSFGKVMLGRLKGEEKLYAIKVLKKEMVIENEELEHTQTERAVLKDMRHPFLVRMYFSFQSPDRLYFVMDYINGGELFYHMQREGKFPEVRASFYSAEIVLAISYLHDRGIVYRDLKLENLLLDNEGHILLTDFGLCKMGVGENMTTNTFCGTPEYLAPEVVEDEDYGIPVDWWSLGVVMYEMMTGRSPFSATDHEELFRQILDAEIYYPTSLSPAAKDCLQGFLTRNPEERLGSGPNGLDDIASHPFFESLDFGKLEAKQLEPPFKPKVSGDDDTTNFDPMFTSEPVALTPPDEHELIADDEQEAFVGFTFISNEKLK